MRLNTINHLRVRRPNQNEQNPCVVVMSSMLSMFAPLPWRDRLSQSLVALASHFSCEVP